MRKCLIIACSVLVLLTFLVLPVGAIAEMPKGMDLFVDKKIISKLEKAVFNEDEVVGVYRYVGSFWHFYNGHLSTYKTFDEMLAEQRPSIYIAKSQENTIRWLSLYTDDSVKYTQYTFRHDVTPVIKSLVDSPDKVLDRVPELEGELPALCVFNLGSEGCAIYLQAKEKGYVYLTNHRGDKEYLIPADTFMKYALWHMVAMQYFWDLSVYDINSTRFNLNAPLTGPINLCISIVAIIAAVVLLIYFRKMRQKRLAQKVSQWTEENA